jgi:peptide/nickel transport system ATP-binding protein
MTTPGEVLDASTSLMASDRGHVDASTLAVCVDDLTVTFTRNSKAVHALRGVSFSVAKSEVVAVVGESGSGKSALGLALLGLLPRRPAPLVTGRATVCGVDMTSAPEEMLRNNRRRNLGAVFQDPMTSLNPTMRIGQQVAEAAGSVDVALELMSAVGIPEPAKRLRQFPHELSGGLRQRVMIAMAIAGNPPLVIADEPTTALDVTVQAQILELIATLRRARAMSFVFVTHDLAVARQVADRIIVLYGGRIVEEGPASQVLASPTHPYTVGLLRSRVTMKGDRNMLLPTLSGDPLDPTLQPIGCAYAPRCPISRDVCAQGTPKLVAVELGGVEHGDVGHRAACVVRTSAREPLALQEETLVAAGIPRLPIGEPKVVLQANDLTKTFPMRVKGRRGELFALRGVSMQLYAGESIAVVGESGSGKSTLLRMFAGLSAPDSGTLERTGGRPQMVFQDAGASLTPWMPIGELLDERLSGEKISKEERRDRVARALELVDLSAEVVHTRPYELSGGQRQRVAIARAIIVAPSILLCDEPTSALDVSLAASIINLLGRLRRELSIAMVFVTHDLAVARTVADRIAVMYLGRIVEDGPVEEVCADPGHPYTRALLASIPGELNPERIFGEPASPMSPPTGCSFHPRCPVAEERCKVSSPLLASDGHLGVTHQMSAHHDSRLVACVHWGER